MTRRHWMWTAIALSGCGGGRPNGPVLPETVAQIWRRKEQRDLPASEAPDPLPRKSVRRILRAIYEGPGTLELTVYELASSAAALDAVQHWRPAADTVFFYSDRYFAVVKWQQAERDALRAFVREIEERLGSGN